MKIPDVVLTCLALSFMAVCATTFAGRLYKWLDDEGQVHYTDSPPAGITIEEPGFPVDPGLPCDAVASGLRPGENELLRKAAERRSALKRSRREYAREHELKQAECRRARRRYQEEVRKPGSAGGDHKARARDYYEDMRDVCR